MQTLLLTDDEFARTFAQPMTRVPAGEEPVVEFWTYFDNIPAEHFQLHDCSLGRVEYVYRDSGGAFEHVLVDSETSNVFMVLVIDRVLKEVHGHYMLNLAKRYGVDRTDD